MHFGAYGRSSPAFPLARRNCVASFRKEWARGGSKMYNVLFINFVRDILSILHGVRRRCFLQLREERDPWILNGGAHFSGVAQWVAYWAPGRRLSTLADVFSYSTEAEQAAEHFHMEVHAWMQCHCSRRVPMAPYSSPWHGQIPRWCEKHGVHRKVWGGSWCSPTSINPKEERGNAQAVVVPFVLDLRQFRDGDAGDADERMSVRMYILIH